MSQCDKIPLFWSEHVTSGVDYRCNKQIRPLLRTRTHTHTYMYTWVRNQSAGGRGWSYSTVVYRQGTLTILTQSVNMKEEGEMKSENVSLRPAGAAAAPFLETLCIFGTGDLGRSLGLRLLQSGYRVVYGSRRPDSCGPVPPGAQVRHRVRSLPEMLQEGEKKECFAHFRVFLFLHSLCFSFFPPGDEPCKGSQVSLSDLCLRSQRTLWIPADPRSPSWGKGKHIECYIRPAQIELQRRSDTAVYGTMM